MQIYRLGVPKLYFDRSVFVTFVSSLRVFHFVRPRRKNGVLEVAILAEGRDLDLDSRVKTSLRGQRETSELLVATLSSGY